jgi:Rps23 Pro-64 3,4-dihydroxylase Tpa1-like proline 4-hydroxylase
MYPMDLNKKAVARLIADKLEGARDSLRGAWASSTPVRHLTLEDLLPVDYVRTLADHFPSPDSLMLRSSLRERKWVGVDVQRYDPRISDCLYAFQEPEVIAAVTAVTGIGGLEADATLYASGISVMGRGGFLNPHLDNSHDGDRRRYRALNLLFYVSSNWKLENGGNLELWPDRVREPVTVPSLFNRLVVMETGRRSWHSVSEVRVDQPRLCLSNYYFTATAPEDNPYTHVTTFAGRPEQPVRRVVLRLDGLLRNLMGRIVPQRLRNTKHRRTLTGAAPPSEGVENRVKEPELPTSR